MKEFKPPNRVADNPLKPEKPHDYALKALKKLYHPETKKPKRKEDYLETPRFPRIGDKEL
jgi:hypothetical protein